MKISVGEHENETFMIEICWRWLFAIKIGEYIDFLVWRDVHSVGRPLVSVPNYEADEIRRHCFKDYQINGRGWEMVGTRITLKGIQRRRAYKRECKVLNIRPERFWCWIVDKEIEEKYRHQRDIERRLRIVAVA